MKPTRYQKWAMLALALAISCSAAAQSNGVPGPTAYPAFTQFITQRNIFNPNRYSGSEPAPPHLDPQRVASAPGFGLVGTVVCEGGALAFFDGNDTPYRKVLRVSGAIADYRVEAITPAYVRRLRMCMGWTQAA